MNYNNLFIEGLDFPLFYESFPSNPPNITLPPDDINTLSKQVESLPIDLHTQALRIEVQKAKRQRLGSSLKRVKKEIITPLHLVSQAYCDINLQRKDLQDLKIKYDNETVLLRSLTYRGIARLHQILFGVIPCAPMTSD